MDRSLLGACRVLFVLALVPAPAGFRRAYATRMFDVLTDEVTEAYERNGWLAGSSAAVLCCFDALRASVAERGEMIARDLGYALRVLAKTPLFSAIIIGTLALAIGANAAVFSVVNAVLLHPLPYAHADRLVNVYESTKIGPTECLYCSFSLPNLRSVRTRSRTLSDIAGYDAGSATVGGAGRALSINVLDVDEHFFGVLGFAPKFGRSFTRGDTRQDAPPVAMLSERFWRSRFGADPHAVGRIVRIEGVPARIIGIVPANFIPPVGPFGVDRYDAYVPLVDSTMNSNRGNHEYKAIARLRPGVTASAARADLGRIAADLRRQYPNAQRDRGFTLRGLGDTLFGDLRPALTIVFAGVIVLLLVACANVANLLLARAAARRYELTVRAAVGATVGRIVALLLAETFVLALAGGCLGLVLATFAVNAFTAARPAGIPRLGEVHVNLLSVAFTAGVVFAVTLLSGLAPALSVARRNLIETLNARGRSAAGGGNAVRNLFVVLQTAFALALAVGGSLVLQSFLRLSHVDPGFRAGGVDVASVRFGSGNSLLRGADELRILAHMSRLQSGAAALPGTESTSLSFIVPFSGKESSADAMIPGRKGPSPVVDFNLVTPGYFTTFRIPLLSGRDFNGSDSATAGRFAIVSRAFARRYFGGNALGKTIMDGVDTASGVNRRVVGVVGDVRATDLDTAPVPLMYFPLAQIPLDPELFLAVKSPLPPRQLGAPLDRVWSSIDPNFPPLVLRSMNSYAAEQTARNRLVALLLSAIAGLALLLAAAGIYSVVAYGVAQRTHDIGLRMALGARPLALVRTIVLRSVALAVAGIAAGIVLLATSSGALAALLYGIGPTDPLTLALVALFVVALALAASLFPAMRATRIDPLVALRYE